MPPGVKRIILDLSLRFQPTDETKRTAYNDRVALLATDCATIPPQFLQLASEQWISEGTGFLPTASDMIRMARKAQTDAETRSAQGKDWYRHYVTKCAERNSINWSSGKAELECVAWLPKFGGGAEIMSRASFNAEGKRQAILKQEGKQYDKRYSDLAREMRS